MTPLDYGAINKKKNQRFGSGWSPDPGENTIRVLPPTSKFFTDLIGFIAYEYRNHFIRLEGRDLTVVRCARDFDEKCPACAFYYDHKNSDDPGVAEIANKFRPSTRFAFNIIDLSDADAGIQTYNCGISVHNEILKYIANEAWGNILDAQEGRNFTITLTPASQSKTGFNSYDVMPSPSPTSVEHLLPDGWKDALDTLEDEVPEQNSVAEIQNIVASAEQDAFGETTPAPGPTPQPPKPSAPKSTGFAATGSQSNLTSVPDANPTPAPDNVNASAGGPDIDPETGKPVCFGDFNREKHPCDDCDVVDECQIRKVGLG